jgi:hypothetical protein
MRLLDGLLFRRRLGSLRGLKVKALAAIRAYNLRILVGHLLKKGGKRMAAVVAQNINLFVASMRARHSDSSRFICPQGRRNPFQAQPILIE